VRLDRRSVRFVVIAIGMALVLSVLTACGGNAAAPTATAVAPGPSSASPAASPARPALASPVASPSPGVVAAVTPTASVAAEAGGETYEVQAGDTLATIAQQFYGDPSQWRRIYDANKDAIGADPDKLKLGMKLTIPPKQS
jgi:nucleoid-associated protein YgaU